MHQYPRFEPEVDENASLDATAGCFRAIGLAMATTLLAFVTLILGIWAVINVPPLTALDYLPPEEAVGRVVTAALDDIGEKPGVEPAAPAEWYPIDDSVNAVYTGVLERAFDLLRATDEGARLFDVLVNNNVLVSVEELPYNAGYTRTRWAWHGWIGSQIVIDAESVRTRNLDSLAAILVHEAAHAERAIDGEACFYEETCDTLPNGVELTEEIAAHGAEARFWQELFGADGKRFAYGSDSGQNRLLEAWRKGDTAFAAYVRSIRSDDREGAGI